MENPKQIKKETGNVCLKWRSPTLQVVPVLFLLFFCSTAFASVDVEKLADAINLAENSKKHPYGILKPYCSEGSEGQCRKGCIQTILKRMRLWDGSGDFITYLSKTYAPLGAKNDPSGLNSNWIKNTRYFYERGVK